MRISGEASANPLEEMQESLDADCLEIALTSAAINGIEFDHWMRWAVRAFAERLERAPLSHAGSVYDNAPREQRRSWLLAAEFNPDCDSYVWGMWMPGEQAMLAPFVMGLR